MGFDAVVEGETILQVEEKTSEGDLACIYVNPKREKKWWHSIPWLGIGYLMGYRQFGWIKPKNPSLFQQEAFEQKGTKFKMIVKLELIDESAGKVTVSEDVLVDALAALGEKREKEVG